jgi:hypothetical protein
MSEEIEEDEYNDNYKYRTAATLYTLETWFVSGMQS